MAQPPPPPPPSEDRTVVEEQAVDPRYAGRRVVVDEPVRRRAYWWPWLLATLLAALAIILLFLWLNERDEGADTNEAPNLVGLRVDEAERQAASRGFVLTVVRRPAARPAGTVLQQGPNAGAALEDGARMIAVVSSGRSQIEVPELVGLRVEAARRLTEASGLSLRTRVVPSDRPNGTILSQDPQPGGDVARGDDVFVTVARGPNEVTVPALRGLTLDSASDRLVQAGLVLEVVRVPAAAPEDTVIAQDPPRGERVEPGSRVRVNVSLGTTSAGETRTVTVTKTETETVIETVTVP